MPAFPFDAATKTDCLPQAWSPNHPASDTKNKSTSIASETSLVSQDSVVLVKVYPGILGRLLAYILYRIFSRNLIYCVIYTFHLFGNI